MSDCGFNIWTDIIIPIIISPILLILKILYDKWSNKKSKTLLLKNKLKLEKTRDKLKNFYWPLYIRLLRDFDIWSRFTIYDKDFYDFVESDTESDLEDSQNIQRCFYKGCGIPVHKNSTSKGPAYCLRHFKFSNIQNIEIVNYTKNEKFCVKIPINYDELTKNKEQNIEIINSDKQGLVELKVNKTTSVDNIPGNITGNQVGEIKELENFSSDMQIDIDSDMYKSLVETLLENYNQINKLIINNISIAEPNSQIGKQLIRFMKFSLIIKALINSNNSINPNKYNSPYPKKLLPIVERKVFNLQKKYNKLIENYYYK